jgi:hypothetical protein
LSEVNQIVVITWVVDVKQINGSGNIASSSSAIFPLLGINSPSQPSQEPKTIKTADTPFVS